MPYFLSELTLIFMFVRFYAVVRHFERYHEFTDLYSQKICRSRFGFKSGRLFTFKCEMNHERKVTIIVLMSLTSTMLLAFILRVFELPFEQNKKEVQFKDNLTDYGSAIWLTVITMTTVGYGDIFPHTIGGQITAMIIAIWGAFIISLLIMVTSDIFQFNPKEEQAVRYIR